MRAALIVTQTLVHEFSKQKAQSSPIYPEAYDASLI